MIQILIFGVLISTLLVITHFVFIIVLWDGYSYPPYFISEKKLRIREMKLFAQVHKTGQGRSYDSKPVILSVWLGINTDQLGFGTY